MRRIRVDPFIVALVAAAVIASLLPATGTLLDVLEAATPVAIGLLFFLYGTRLSTEETVAGLTHWRLHTVVLVTTFGFFPLLGLATQWLEPAVLTPGLSFNMLFNHANPLRVSGVRRSGGSLMCYAGGRPGTELLDLPEEEIRRRFLADLGWVYPELPGLVGETVVQKWRHGNCYHAPGTDFSAMLRHNADPSNAICFAGDYFADVSGTIEDATRSGTEAAYAVASALDLQGAGR